MWLDRPRDLVAVVEHGEQARIARRPVTKVVDEWPTSRMRACFDPSVMVGACTSAAGRVGAAIGSSILFVLRPAGTIMRCGRASSASWLRSAARFCAASELGAGSVHWRPPPRPRDWAIGPPDFVGVGVQRAGTTWWYRLLCDHPSIQRARGKEAHFFDGYFGREFSDSDVEAYHRLFPRPKGSLIGEWSPRYLHDFWTPALLRRAAPEAKILVLLRDPLQRYQSGLRHESRHSRSRRAAGAASLFRGLGR